MTDAVLRAADRGVRVRVLVDDGETLDGDERLHALDAHPGIVPFAAAPSWSFGIGGANATYRTSLDAVQLGGFDLYHRSVDVVLAKEGAFADRVDAGNVGLGVLRNFVATFDIGNAGLYLARGDGFDDGRKRTARL